MSTLDKLTPSWDTLIKTFSHATMLASAYAMWKGNFNHAIYFALISLYLKE